jgi:hypothetical protein
MTEILAIAPTAPACARAELRRYIETLRGADADATDLIWCQVAEGRRMVNVIDTGVREVLDRPWDHAGRATLRSAQSALAQWIRQAREAGEPFLAAAWLPWLHTLRATDRSRPELQRLGRRMWALIEPPRIRREAAWRRLTPPGFGTEIDPVRRRPDRPAPARCAHA